MVSCFCLHIYHHGQRVYAAAHNDPFHRSNIAVVPPPGDGDVALTGNPVFGGLQIHPARIRHEEGSTGMGGVRADQPYLASMGIYLFDSFGNLNLVYRDPTISSMYPIPIRPREKPPRIALIIDDIKKDDTTREYVWGKWTAVLATFLGWLILSEAITGWTLAGTVLVLLGVWGVRIENRQRANGRPEVSNQQPEVSAGR